MKSAAHCVLILECVLCLEILDWKCLMHFLGGYSEGVVICAIILLMEFLAFCRCSQLGQHQE